MLKEKHHFTKENINQIIEFEIGEVFKQVLQACGVFKFSDRIMAMDRFVNTL